MNNAGLDRRAVLKLGGGAGLTLLGSQILAACAPGNPPPGTTTTQATTTTTTTPGWGGYGPLGSPDANGLRLPAGFTSRVVATTGQPVGSSGYLWRPDPDGAATFPLAGGGWALVSNHESASPNGGASRIVFAADGTILTAGAILTGTDRNCAGGATPWGTWLSCEEISRGRVWECDPTGAAAAVDRAAMGLFAHEAVAVHAAGQTLYLTEDKPDGGLYRFRPTSYPNLSSGILEVLCESVGVLSWQPVPDPSAATTSTRYQVASMKPFNGGEGICHLNGVIFFTTKGDNRVWRFEPATNTLSVIYEAATSPTPELTGVDNITTLPNGHLFVAEDQGNMQVVMLAGSLVQAVVELPGVAGSEMTGVCFNPAMTRMYVSSQRNPGRTFEIAGPWRTT